VALALIIFSTVVGAMPAFTKVGLGLLGPEPGSQGYSVRTPLWGTFVASSLALCLALPVALALALIKRELQIPLVSNVLGAVIGTMAGIPPVIYAVCAVFIVPIFMAPKFAGTGLADQRVQASVLGVSQSGFGGLPDRLPNTSFLGGVLLAMLIVPFMVPLIDDALRTVSLELKMGSYALGATRWYTLQHIILPSAMPGIVSAATLGALVAVGEVVIPYFVLGGSENLAVMPDPAWDIFRRTPALTSWAATQMGGLGGESESVQALAVSVSFAAGLFLLVLAFAIMGLEQLVLRRMRRHSA
jgi:phosphate transport system permease protein